MRKATLKYTTSKASVKCVNQTGTIEILADGSVEFNCEAGTLHTMPIDNTKPHLGDLNHPNCTSFSFTTVSGSYYDFDIERMGERVVDGCQRQENEFFGFEKQTF